MMTQPIRTFETLTSETAPARDSGYAEYGFAHADRRRLEREARFARAVFLIDAGLWLARLLKRGVRDLVRICDGRMSGTAYGTVVLHVAPEAAVGGPLALVRTGDWITLDVPARTLTLEVSDEELAARRAQ